MNSICPQCQTQNPWERLYCSDCGACLRGAEMVQATPKKGPHIGRVLVRGMWVVVLLVLVLSLSGMAAVLSRFFL
jgi:predicted amidophosphoribosyltransferase